MKRKRKPREKKKIGVQLVTISPAVFVRDFIPEYFENVFQATLSKQSEVSFIRNENEWRPYDKDPVFEWQIRFKEDWEYKVRFMVLGSMQAIHRIANNSREFILSAGPEVQVEFLRVKLKGALKRIRNGIRNEQKILSIIQNLKTKDPRDCFSIVTTSEKKDRRQGIDFYITFRSFVESFSVKMPLQVKTSFDDQEKHKRFYPKIPSICVARHNNIAIPTVIIEMMEAYAVGKVLHK